MSRGDYMAAAAFYEKILPICEKTNAQECRRVQALALEGLGKTAEAGKDIPAHGITHFICLSSFIMV